LKFGEGLALGIFTLLREELSRGPLVRLGVALATPRLRALARRMDYTEYGGAPLLGVNGTCIIAHGSSTAKATRNSIAVAAEAVRASMVETIRADVARLCTLPQLAPLEVLSAARDEPERVSGTVEGASGLPLSHGSTAEC
jgi:fatty acid/phospholipid biosynthesis enzyme